MQTKQKLVEMGEKIFFLLKIRFLKPTVYNTAGLLPESRTATLRLVNKCSIV